MTIVNRLKREFAKYGDPETKPENLTWRELAEIIGSTKEACKVEWRKYRRRRPSIKIQKSSDANLFEEFLEWKKGKLQHVNEKKVINTFNSEGLHIVSGCWHVPFHNKKLFNSFQELLYDIDFVGFHLIGDFLDLNTLSSHDTGRFPVIKGLTIDQEYLEGNKVLDEIDKLLPDKVEKSYLYGNHEDRWNRYMSNMQSAKTPISSPSIALKLEERGYNVQENWSQDFVKLGQHLELIHGTYYNIHAAKKHMDVLRGSIMFAHTHRIQSYLEGNTGSFNIGCMIDLASPAFNYAARATRTQWQNGFMIVYIDSDGNYYVNQIIVVNDRFVYNGKIY